MNAVSTYQKQTGNENAPMTLSQSSGMSVGSKVMIGVGITAALGIGIYLANNAYKKKQSDKAESKSFTEGSPETTAKEIHMAFDNDGWPGTNTVKLREIITKVKSIEEWNKIVIAYKTLYDKDLNRRIEDELQSSEFKEFLAIKQSKPYRTGQSTTGNTQYRAWAIRLRAAFEKTYGPFPGTDDNAVKAVFNEIPTQRAYINVGIAYNKEYPGSDFTKDLKDDVDYDYYMKIILKKKQA